METAPADVLNWDLSSATLDAKPITVWQPTTHVNVSVNVLCFSQRLHCVHDRPDAIITRIAEWTWSLRWLLTDYVIAGSSIWRNGQSVSQKGFE